MSIKLQNKEWSSTFRYFGWVEFENMTYSFELVVETFNNSPFGVSNFIRIHFNELINSSLKKKLRKHIQSELLKDDNWKEKITLN